MHLLNNALIRDQYDVVVIGAGIGGLTAAALLAKKGSPHSSLNSTICQEVAAPLYGARYYHGRGVHGSLRFWRKRV